MIPRINKILYATDLSKNSAYAFRYAVNSAQKHDAQIHILHVVELPPASAQPFLLLYMDKPRMEKLRQETKDELCQKIKTRLDEFARRELQGEEETLSRIRSIDVVFGDPAEQILNKAIELNCDIVIMGTHGKGLISHAFLGSVSEKVLHRIRKPVFIIPIPEGQTDITIEEI